MVLPLASSCQYDDAELVRAEELGAKVKEYVVDEQAGTVEIDYLSNLEGTITFAEPVDWAVLSSKKFNGDGQVTVVYDENDGFPRMAQIELIANGDVRRDTIMLQQKGAIMPLLELPATNAIAYNKQGATKVAINTNISSIDEFDIKVKYVGEGSEEWVDEITMDGGFLYIKTIDNATKDVRNAVITLTYVDGWAKKQRVSISLTQANSDNAIGVDKSFDDIRALANGGSAVITGDYIITGYVVSDKASKNAGDNTRTTTAAIDYDVCERTVYFESLDGQYGFCLEFASIDDNTLERNTKVQLLVKEAKITAYEEPERYVISGLTAAKVLTAEKVDASAIPAKPRKLSEITDDDLYTQVQLQDVEFPVRQGPLCPVNEGYTIATGAHRLSKYPKLIIDGEGNSAYLYTNTTCVYRNNGKKLPYGKGTLNLVVVHEKCRQYVDEDADDEDDCGYIGRYQFRHHSLSDIYDGMSDGILDDVCNNKIISEYRYMKSNGDGTWATTYGKNGDMTHSYAGYTTSRGDHGYGSQSFKYLGPIGNLASRPFGLNRGNENGLGIFLEDGSEYGNAAMGYPFNYINDDETGSNYGKGWIPAACYCAWGNGYWWDDENERPYYWVIHFSTKGIEAKHLTMQMAAVNFGTVGAPRFWKVEWGIDNEDPSWESASWKKVGEYALPDIANWSNTLYCQFSAYKEIFMELPLEMLDRDDVYLRLMPSKDVAGDGVSYQGGEINKSGKTASSVMDYFAIRYSNN